MSTRVALHVHSSYSDGEFSIPELREVFLRLGCRAVLMSDHADFFTADKVAAYVEDCARASSTGLLFLPGLEYTCQRGMHILGYGMRSLVDSTDPECVIAHIRESGGVAVIAHPRDDMFPWIEQFQVRPHGIEVWNSKYDGRYAPRPGTFALVGRMRGRGDVIWGFYGQDLHWHKQARTLFTELETSVESERDILRQLEGGLFAGRKDDLQLSSNGDLDPALARRFHVVHHRARRMRQWMVLVKKATGPIGRNIPAPIKAQLRRLF
jgi:hypothetical protein